MSEVFRELEFTYRGQHLTFVPSMAVVRQLHTVCKDSATTLVDLATSLSNGHPDLFTLSYVLQKLLKAAGVEEPEERCYQWVATGAGGKVVEMQTFMAALLNTVFPEVDAGKKPEAPKKPQGRRTQKTAK